MSDTDHPTTDGAAPAADEDRALSLELDGITKEYTEDDGSTVVAVDDVSLDVYEGEFIVLVGPSGCGKTTTLRIVAGLEQPTRGSLRIDGEDVAGREPRERDIAMVFQNYALYPHKTVRGNIAFPLKIRKYPDDETEQRVQDTANLLGIGELLDRHPADLSGGQQQRVALGRAIVRDPAVFLFDEPLSNLDAKLRIQMRTELNKLHDRVGRTSVYVTHDQVEAMTLSDRVVVMNDGSVQQVAPPKTVYQQPANRFVAGFIGEPPMNFFPVTTTPEGDRLRVDAEGFSLVLPPKSARRSRRGTSTPSDSIWGSGPKRSRTPRWSSESSPTARRSRRTWPSSSRWGPTPTSRSGPSSAPTRRPRSSPPASPTRPTRRPARRSRSPSTRARFTCSTPRPGRTSSPDDAPPDRPDRLRTHRQRPRGAGPGGPGHRVGVRVRPCPETRDRRTPAHRPRRTRRPPRRPRRRGGDAGGARGVGRTDPRRERPTGPLGLGLRRPRRGSATDRPRDGQRARPLSPPRGAVRHRRARRRPRRAGVGPHRGPQGAEPPRLRVRRRGRPRDDRG
nr:ABC transporter ATP-binding protein [Halolamina pelagica]